MDKNAELLLYAWGYWMRRSPGVNLGYPRQAVGAELIHTGEDKSKLKHRRRPWRKWNGRIETLRYMSPPPNPKQSRVTNPYYGDQWPEEVMWADRVIASMPFDYRQCLLAKYWLELTEIEAANQLNETREVYREFLEHAEARFEQGLHFRPELIA